MIRTQHLVLGGLLSAIPCLCQNPAEPTAEAQGSVDVTLVPIHTAADDPVGGEYGTWAAGHNYKVEFRPSGIRFIPYLGPTEPKNREWRFEMESVEVGGQPWVAGTTGLEPRSTAYRYEFDRGAIVEAYDVREDGLEQTFVIQRQPELDGDLVVSGRVQGNVQAVHAAPDHRSLTFTDEHGRALIEYGNAFVVHANGNKQAIESSFDGERIELRVPAAVLQHATYPLVIDPLIANVAIPGGSFAATTRGLDVVSDEQNNRVFMTLIRRASSSDADLFVVAMDSQFTGTATTVFADMTASWSTTEGSVAGSVNPIQIATALVRVFGHRNSGVRYHVRAGSSLTFGTSVGFVPLLAGHYDQRVDIGGMGATGTHVMMVFERRNQVQAAIEGVTAITLDVSVSPSVLGTAFPVRSTGYGTTFGFFRTSHPTITKRSRTASQPDRWLVAFEERQVTGTTGVLDVDYVVVRAVSVNGTHSTGYWTPSQSSPLTHHTRGPKIAGRPGSPDNRNQFGVAFIERELSGGNTITAFEGLTWPVGAEWPTHSWGQGTLTPPGPGPIPLIGDVSSDLRTRSHWLVSTTAGLHRVDRSGNEIDQVFFPPSSTNYFFPGGISYERSGQFVALSCSAQWPFGLPGPVTGRVFQNPAATPTTTTGPACGSAAIEWTTQLGSRGPRHDQQIGHDFTQVEVTGTPSGTLHFLLYSLGTQMLDLTGTGGVGNGCWLLVQPTWNLLHVQNGAEALWDFPLPSALPSLTLHFQDWYLLPGNATLRSTERLNVPIAR